MQKNKAERFFAGAFERWLFTACWHVGAVRLVPPEVAFRFRWGGQFASRAEVQRSTRARSGGSGWTWDHPGGRGPRRRLPPGGARGRWADGASLRASLATSWCALPPAGFRHGPPGTLIGRGGLRFGAGTTRPGAPPGRRGRQASLPQDCV